MTKIYFQNAKQKPKAALRKAHKHKTCEKPIISDAHYYTETDQARSDDVSGASAKFLAPQRTKEADVKASWSIVPFRCQSFRCLPAYFCCHVVFKEKIQ